MLPRGRDMQREVLLNIQDEKTFLSACTIDKATYKLCDDVFFRNRIARSFSLLLDKKPLNLSWKKYYLKTVYYIDLLNDLGFKWRKRYNSDPEIYYNLLKDYILSGYILSDNANEIQKFLTRADEFKRFQLFMLELWENRYRNEEQIKKMKEIVFN